MSTDGDKDARPNAAEGGRKSLMGEVWAFLMTNKKWWLIPLLAAILLLGALVVIGGAGGVAPFIYTH